MKWRKLTQKALIKDSVAQNPGRTVGGTTHQKGGYLDTLFKRKVFEGLHEVNHDLISYYFFIFPEGRRRKTKNLNTRNTQRVQ
jgi:hypothetical protein